MLRPDKRRGHELPSITLRLCRKAKPFADCGNGIKRLKVCSRRGRRREFWYLLSMLFAGSYQCCLLWTLVAITEQTISKLNSQSSARTRVALGLSATFLMCPFHLTRSLKAISREERIPDFVVAFWRRRCLGVARIVVRQRAT